MRTQTTRHHFVNMETTRTLPSTHLDDPSASKQIDQVIGVSLNRDDNQPSIPLTIKR